MANHQIIIDPEKCIGCGLCVKDCVSGNLALTDGIAAPRMEHCIACGHCEAICPRNAVTLTGFPEEPEEYLHQTRLDPETLMQAIKTRRSIRQFRKDPVPQEIVDQIIEAGRYAPTGSNSQDLTYIILDEKKDDFEAQGVAMFRRLLSAGKLFSSSLKNMVLDDQFFFKGAPLVILIASRSAVDASIVAENMCFMAEAHGLGVLYSGFFTECANHLAPIHKQLELPAHYKVITTLVIGYPDVRYRRTVRREPADIRKL